MSPKTQKVLISNGDNEAEEEEQKPTTSKIVETTTNSSPKSGKKNDGSQSPSADKKATKIPNKKQPASRSIKKKVKRKRKRTFSDASHEELLRQVQQRYGNVGTGTKSKDELKEPILVPKTGEVKQPASYERMMARAIEAHLNRMLQPEPPADLLPSNWLCALCFQPSGAIDQQGELYGPYFVKLSDKCQPPEQLVPRALLRATMEKDEERTAKTGVRGHNVDHSKPTTSANALMATSSSSSLKRRNTMSPTGKGGKHGRHSSTTLVGTLDIWLHGDCALWTPELYMVGGRFPMLPMNLPKYWAQVCAYCGLIGASIPIKEPKNGTAPTTMHMGTSKRKKKSTTNLDGSSNSSYHSLPSPTSTKPKLFLHHKCAIHSGLKMDPLLLTASL